MLDQLIAELVKVRASGTGTSQAAEARDSIEKPFSHWIRGAPKENGHYFMIPTEYGMVFRQRTMQSVSI